MDEGTKFIKNLLTAIEDSDFSEAELSLKAGLNRRAVTDLREGRVRSPKITTVFRLAEALGIDPGEMLGLGPRPKVQADLASVLAEYSEEEQERLAIAFRRQAPARATE